MVERPAESKMLGKSSKSGLTFSGKMFAALTTVTIGCSSPPARAFSNAAENNHGIAITQQEPEWTRMPSVVSWNHIKAKGPATAGHMQELADTEPTSQHVERTDNQAHPLGYNLPSGATTLNLADADHPVGSHEPAPSVPSAVHMQELTNNEPTSQNVERTDSQAHPLGSREPTPSVPSVSEMRQRSPEALSDANGHERSDDQLPPSKGRLGSLVRQAGLLLVSVGVYSGAQMSSDGAVGTVTTIHTVIAPAPTLIGQRVAAVDTGSSVSTTRTPSPKSGGVLQAAAKAVGGIVSIGALVFLAPQLIGRKERRQGNALGMLASNVLKDSAPDEESKAAHERERRGIAPSAERTRLSLMGTPRVSSILSGSRPDNHMAASETAVGAKWESSSEPLPATSAIAFDQGTKEVGAEGYDDVDNTPAGDFGLKDRSTSLKVDAQSEEPDGAPKVDAQTSLKVDAQSEEPGEAHKAASHQQHGGARSQPKLRQQLQGDWVELESAEGEVYYANTATKETSWLMPVGALASQSSSKVDLPSGAHSRSSGVSGEGGEGRKVGGEEGRHVQVRQMIQDFSDRFEIDAEVYESQKVKLWLQNNEQVVKRIGSSRPAGAKADAVQTRGVSRLA